MSDFKQRLLDEKQQLQERHEKLNVFLLSEKADGIDPLQKSLLLIQFAAMATYLECLSQRIAWLEQTVN